MFSSLRSRREKGQGLVEYALVLVLVAVVVIAILTVLGPQIGNVFSQVTSGLGVSGGGGAAQPAQQLSAGCQAISGSYTGLGTVSFIGAREYTAGETVVFNATQLYGAADYFVRENVQNGGGGLVGYTSPGTPFSFTIPSDGQYDFVTSYNVPATGDWSISCN